MKFRGGFISNSSSCNFIVSNKTNQDLDYSELVRDLRDIIDQYNRDYGLSPYTPFTEEQHKNFIESAKSEKYTFKANSSIKVGFGDNHGEFSETVISSAVDYMLRDDFESDRFSIKFVEMDR